MSRPRSWSEQQRQAWIDHMLRLHGLINRSHLELRFGISQPQASKDLQVFQRDHPDRMRYDLSKKCYVRA